MSSTFINNVIYFLFICDFKTNLAMLWVFQQMSDLVRQIRAGQSHWPLPQRSELIYYELDFKDHCVAVHATTSQVTVTSCETTLFFSFNIILLLRVDLLSA